MAHIEPMDVDSIGNDFDDKENSLQNNNVLPRTPSTEKGYEELDVSELNMKLRYSMTPATSPMSRSFTSNCRENKVCDNENNSINTILNDNSNLTHSFNSTITDSILKSPKFPLQVLPTEHFVDDNGNPIVRSLDVECNNVTITVNGMDNIDDNLSLPSTSSSLTHTPEATTPTKEIAKDGGSPIMRGLKSVLNMFRSSQSPIPPDDIITNDLNPFESQKKEESSNLPYLGSTPTNTNKNKENIPKTNSPLKESLVFNEDLEKELLWKDETTILFKEEKIPVYKLFFPPNSAALESLNSKTIEKENINTTVECVDGSSNKTVSADKDMTEVVKSSNLESETVNSPESDSEFVDCETSYTKNDTRLLDDTTTKNILPEISITDGNTFQPNETFGDESSLSVMAVTDLAKESNAIITRTQSEIKKADNDEKQTIHNELPILQDFPDQTNILSDALQEDICIDLSHKSNTFVHTNVIESVQCSNETFNLEKSETTDLQTDKKYNNDIITTSNIVNNEVTFCEESNEYFKEFYPSQIADKIEDIYSGEKVCDLDSTIVLKESTLKKQEDTSKINDIKVPLDTQVVNKVNIDVGVLQDQIITMDKTVVMPLVKCEKEINADNKLDSEIIEDTILNKKHDETETFVISDQIIQLETKDIKTVNYNLPSDIPLPCDSDIEKDNLQDMKEERENYRDNDKTVNISSNNLNIDLSYSTESTKKTIDDMTPLTEIHSETLPYPTINYTVANTSITQTFHSQLAPSEEMSNKITFVTVNESDDPEIYNTEKCIPKVIGDSKDISSNIINSEIFASNGTDSVSGINLDVTHTTQDNKNVMLQNHEDFVQTRKSTDVGNETVVKIQYDEDASPSSTNNKIVTGVELDISKHDLEDIENPFLTKNKLTASFEVQGSDSVIGDVSAQNHIESASLDKNNISNEIHVGVKYDDVNIPTTDINTSVSGNDLDVTRQTQDNIYLIPQNHDDFVQTNKSTDVENETVVKIQYDEVSFSSTNNKTVTEMELDVSKHDLEDIANPFETKNKLTDSLEVSGCGRVIGDVFAQNRVESVPQVTDDKKYITNEMDVRAKYDDVDISMTNVNTSVIGMDLDVSIHDSENYELPGRDTTNKSDVSIKEEVSLPTTFKNSLVIEMELDVSKSDLEDVSNVSRIYRNSIDTKKQLQIQSSSEEKGRESVIENMNAKKNLENISVDDYNLITNENHLNINEVISIPTNITNSVTEMELDVSKHDLIAGENPIKASCQDKDNEGCEIMNNAFKRIPILIDEKLELTSKSDVTINDTFILPLTKEISPEIDLGVSKYDEANIERTLETKGFTHSPQISPKQGGYRIDFDEIDDPFNTKSIPTCNKSKEDCLNTTRCNIITDNQNRPEPERIKTLQDRKKCNVTNEGANASFEIVNRCLENIRVKEIDVNNGEKPECIEQNTNSAHSTSDDLHHDIEMNIPGNCTFLGQTEKSVEDAEIHLSNKISSSSSKIYESKNVFNLPELNDKKFKPFTTISNINDSQRSSSGVCNNPLEGIGSTRSEAEKTVQDLDLNTSPNLSNVTCSSKNTDDVISHVNTEDEDTVEGPFLEAEDFADIVKVTDFETEKDMMNFEDLPTRTNDDDNGEFFIDAEAFEFLLNQNKSNVVADSGKESLFLKFDPLFAKRISSDGVLAALNKIQKRQSTPKKVTPLKIMHEENPTPGPSTTTPIGVAAPVATDIVEEPVAAMSKPMMVVNPAIASFVSPRKSTTPPKVNRRSLTFTSPAMAVIDRLLSLSGNSSSLDQDSSLPVSREYNETDYALTQLRELLADKEIQVSNLRSESKELKERFAILESQVRSLETESEERLRKVKDLNDNLAEKNRINKSMAIVVEEYERTIASLIAEMEQEKKQNAEERMKLISERDEQTAHLASMEVSFSDLHSKYEKSKQIILSMKANEDTYKKSLNEFEVNLLKMQTNYDLLKQHATSKLNHANQELEKYNRAHDAEVLKLNAMIKRKELHITSLEESLTQKTKANEELTAICDELINKVG